MHAGHLALLAPVAAAWTLTSAAFAQDSVSTHHDLGSGETLVVETEFGGSDYYETRLVVRSDTSERVLFAGMATASAGSYSVTRRPDGFELRYPCGNRYAPEDQTCVERWVRRASGFVRVHRAVDSPWASASAELERALREGRVGDARALIAMMGPTPDGGHTDVSGTRFAAFAAATARLVERHAAEGRTETSAALVLELWFEPPIVTTSRASGRWVCRDGRVHVAPLEVSPEDACGERGGNVWPDALREPLVTRLGASQFPAIRALAARLR